MASDFDILMWTYHYSKSSIGLFVVSGFLSFAYNLVQFNIVHTLSPSATAFGGNFNKAALIFLTLLLPFLRTHELPGSPYIQVIWAAVIVNIVEFSYYSYLQIQAKQESAARESGKAELLGSDEESNSDETESTSAEE